MKCMLCGRCDNITHHHLLCGANRRAADRHGLVIPLCGECHDKVQTDGHLMALSKAVGQLLFEMQGHTRREAIAEFGQDYVYRLEREE